MGREAIVESAPELKSSRTGMLNALLVVAVIGSAPVIAIGPEAEWVG